MGIRIDGCDGFDLRFVVLIVEIFIQKALRHLSLHYQNS